MWGCWGGQRACSSLPLCQPRAEPFASAPPRCSELLGAVVCGEQACVCPSDAGSAEGAAQRVHLSLLHTLAPGWLGWWHICRALISLRELVNCNQTVLRQPWAVEGEMSSPCVPAALWPRLSLCGSQRGRAGAWLLGWELLGPGQLWGPAGGRKEIRVLERLWGLKITVWAAAWPPGQPGFAELHPAPAGLSPCVGAALGLSSLAGAAPV